MNSGSSASTSTAGASARDCEANGAEGGAISMRSPRRTPLDALVASPLTVTSPALIIRATCDREYSGARRADTNTSSRIPVQLLSAVMVAPVLMAPDYFTTESPQHQDGGRTRCLAPRLIQER